MAQTMVAPSNNNATTLMTTANTLKSSPRAAVKAERLPSK